MASSSEPKDWQSYPQNLSSITSYDHEYDLRSYSTQLRDDSIRLFIDPTDSVNLKTVHIGEKANEALVESRLQLEDYLQNLDLDDGLHIILIPQQGSWGRLVIDERSIKQTLTRLEVFPRFLDILRSFGQRVGFEDDSAGGVFLRNNEERCTHEASYLVKLVEEHGRIESTEPWSIRQMGVYHRKSGESGNAFIILNPSRSFLRRLKYMQEDPDRISPGAKSRAQLTKVIESQEPSFSLDDIRIEDAQEIQVLQDKCQQLAHVLDLNCELLRQLRKHLDRISASRSCAESLVSLLSESTIHVKRADRLLKRLDGTIALTQKILDFRCLASLQHSSGSMEKLARLTRDDNLMMKELTEKAARDTDAMRWITFLTLIYLPASFVATMMGMNYISVRTVNGGFSINFAGEFWIFFFLTGVLLVITLITYYIYIRRARLRGTCDSKSRKIGKEESVSTQ
ncbi:hypothetical protein BDV96DRAFT_692342 [Lophiotrema nucula]|uniref:CorA-like transporter domain-containing protein n=1 Tax=Lophiotrema nucula TaxID=690887 RepID=A0A6A5YR03_9PLEO|nr:hypothetical protein BDV96DRAFT_692342 [Lophiotrema nucula]